MSCSVTFYPWDSEKIHIFELIDIVYDDSVGYIDFYGYFNSKYSIPFDTIFIISGKVSLYITVTSIEKSRIPTQYSIINNFYRNDNMINLKFKLKQILHSRQDFLFAEEDINTNQIMKGVSRADISSDEAL